MKCGHLPEKQGLYDPAFEHDACGVGFVCDIAGNRSNETVMKGLEVLDRLSHRGATGADPRTGDGAGLLIQMPHEFFARVSPEAGIELPSLGNYGTGLIFLPTDNKDRESCKEILSAIVKKEGQNILGWRSVPVDDSDIGTSAKNTQPVIEQIFIKRGETTGCGLSFERKLYVIRKRAENKIRSLKLKQGSLFYITNISARTFSYKGLLMPCQVDRFFVDLRDREIKSAITLVHSRYSTNTFPTWDLAQPFRFLAHNGEINTLRGNINWMKAREGLLKSGVFGKDIKDIFPVITPGGSDSASLDNIFELLVLAGRPLEHVMMMLIPNAWEQDKAMSSALKNFYKYHACIMEPWDGPAAITFTDGVKVCAVLDRNGLRPARYIITKDKTVVMASEAGALDIDPGKILVSGKIEPGKMLLIDTSIGKIIEDSEIKNNVAKTGPYGSWLRKNMVEFPVLRSGKTKDRPIKDLTSLEKAFGYSREDIKFILKPMAEKAQEPVGSMGNDTPHAVLSNESHLLFSYFKQLFAQVTNPAIDPIREELVMSLETYLGPEKNLLDETPLHCHKLRIKHPILTNEDLDSIRKIKINGFRTKTISLLFGIKNKNGLSKGLEDVCLKASSAIKEGYTFVILSDRGVKKGVAAIPSLLALGAVHQHLVKKSLRTRIGLIVESAEPREVHHLALLFGYGADCVNPYLAYEVVEQLTKDGDLALNRAAARRNYIKALEKGILKVLSKMGISTLQSYRGAQIFEALGLSDAVIEKCFTGTPSRIGGIGLDTIVAEVIKRNEEAYPESGPENFELKTGGLYQWKKDGEFHLWNPETIAALQEAAWCGDYKKYKEFSGLINDQTGHQCTLRSLLKFKNTKAIPLDEVEKPESIVKRFATGAMSFGSISKEAHETIAIAMNRLGAKSNTGEGGEDPARFSSIPDCDSTRSAIKQVASGRFGVTTNYLVNADELQIKIAQGAKPGEGGQLPGHKVSLTIAKTRYTTPGVTLISPPPHHDIYSIEDLAQLIFDLKNVNTRARISVKLVSEVGVGTVAAGVAKGHADMILISGGDGGTGASPLSSIKHAGLPWELGLSETHQTLVLNSLRSRVRLQTDGQMRTGRDVAIAALLGADEFGFASAILVILGCVMLRHCNLNNCSVGVATQDEILRKRFKGRPEFIINYLRFVVEEMREIMAGLGIRTVDEMIGRVDLLEPDSSISCPKGKTLDFSKILYKPLMHKNITTYDISSHENDTNKSLDLDLIRSARDSLDKAMPVKIERFIDNTNRTTGAMLSGEICRIRGEDGLPEDTIQCKFRGVAGQSFGAFLTKGVSFELEGMANDYVGKGISGGKIIIRPDRNSDYKAEENIILGNTAFYGAISGEAYIRGVSGERFCIRNSGLYTVVEGVGDHGCEYMTGGRVIILGKTGRNFAAGMSGGIAYIYDKDRLFKRRCNLNMVKIENIYAEDEDLLRNMIANHLKFTQSPVAEKILNAFRKEKRRFLKVMPIEYKRIMEAKKTKYEQGLSEVSDG
ncbi:MAG: glutamate synthase large subunit [Candidatus Omnitrophota bacterium]